MPVVYQRAAARRDLVQQFVHLAEQAGLDIAERFLTKAEISFNDLARQPMIGVPLTLRHSNLAGIRKWHITDFDNHLIFYLPHSDGVSIELPSVFRLPSGGFHATRFSSC